MPWRTFFVDSSGQQMLPDMYWFSRKSMIYNNATLSFYIQLFLLHILGISQLSIMKWAESSLHFLACLKTQMLLILEEQLKFFSVGWARSPLSWPKCPLLTSGILLKASPPLIFLVFAAFSLQEAKLWCSLNPSVQWWHSSPCVRAQPLTEVGRSLIFCTDHHSPEIQLLSPGIAAVTPNTAWARYTNNPCNELQKLIVIDAQNHCRKTPCSWPLF